MSKNKCARGKSHWHSNDLRFWESFVDNEDSRWLRIHPCVLETKFQRALLQQTSLVVLLSEIHLSLTVSMKGWTYCSTANKPIFTSESLSKGCSCDFLSSAEHLKHPDNNLRSSELDNKSYPQTSFAKFTAFLLKMYSNWVQAQIEFNTRIISISRRSKSCHQPLWTAKHTDLFIIPRHLHV